MNAKNVIVCPAAIWENTDTEILLLLAVDEKAWILDAEFARQMLAGLNPLAIECLKVNPLQKSSLSSVAFRVPKICSLSC